MKTFFKNMYQQSLCTYINTKSSSLNYYCFKKENFGNTVKHGQYSQQFIREFVWLSDFTVSEEPLELNRYDQFEFASDKTDGDSPPELPWQKFPPTDKIFGPLVR
jgi:hypothetical protein